MKQTQSRSEQSRWKMGIVAGREGPFKLCEKISGEDEGSVKRTAA